MTAAERHVEELCDSERYLALYKDEDEEAMYHEEELKRLRQALNSDNSYSQVGYSYEATDHQEQEYRIEDGEGIIGEDSYIPPPELEVPPHMVVPPTIKLNAIIEKTATFICHQGPQMEILLKTKQGNNPQFLFLCFDNALNPFYRHMISMIKSGKYVPKSERSEEDNFGDQSGDHYLHPQLSAKPDLAPAIPTIQYKPSADCAYSKLVTQIKGKQAEAQARNELEALQSLPEPQSRPQSPPVTHAVPTTWTQADGSHTATIATSSLSGENTPVSPGSPASCSSPHTPCSHHSFSSSTSSSSSDSPKHNSPIRKEAAHESPVQNDDASVSSPIVQSGSVALEINIPPWELQTIIDKMASYVAKNGRDFEDIVKSKGDKRFEFLESSHEYHAYYDHKVTIYEGLEKTEQKKQSKQNKELEGTEQEDVVIEDKEKVEEEAYGEKPKAKPAPVCFSIKPKEPEARVLEKPSALPVEESTDEEESDEVKVKEEKPKPEKKKEERKEEKREEKKDKRKEKHEEKEIPSAEENEEKRAEEKIKDKLAAAAREKLAQASREKQLQLERKRKAALFLTLLKKENNSKPQEPVIGPHLPPEMQAAMQEEGNQGEDEANDIVSLPSPEPPDPADIPTPPASRHSSVHRDSTPGESSDSSVASPLTKVPETKQVAGNSLAASMMHLKKVTLKNHSGDKSPHRSRRKDRHKQKQKNRRGKSPSNYRNRSHSRSRSRSKTWEHNHRDKHSKSSSSRSEKSRKRIHSRSPSKSKPKRTRHSHSRSKERPEKSSRKHRGKKERSKSPTRSKKTSSKKHKKDKDRNKEKEKRHQEVKSKKKSKQVETIEGSSSEKEDGQIISRSQSNSRSVSLCKLEEDSGLVVDHPVEDSVVASESLPGTSLKAKEKHSTSTEPSESPSSRSSDLQPALARIAEGLRARVRALLNSS